MAIFSKIIHSDQATKKALEQQRLSRRSHPTQILLSAQIQQQQAKFDATLGRLKHTQQVLEKICNDSGLSSDGVGAGAAPSPGAGCAIWGQEDRSSHLTPDAAPAVRGVQAGKAGRRAARTGVAQMLRRRWDVCSLLTYHHSLEAEMHRREKELCVLETQLRLVGADAASEAPAPPSAVQRPAAGRDDAPGGPDVDGAPPPANNGTASPTNNGKDSGSTATARHAGLTALEASGTACAGALAAVSRASSSRRRYGRRGDRADAQPAPECTALFRRAAASLKRVHDGRGKPAAGARAGEGEGGGGGEGEGAAEAAAAEDGDGAVEGEDEGMRRSGFEAVLLLLTLGAAVAAGVVVLTCFLRPSERR